MKTSPQCAPCLLNRVLYEAELSTKDKALVFKAVESGLDYLRENFHEGADATGISTGIHHKVYEILQDPDPYREKKAQSNAIASAMIPAVAGRINTAAPADRFRMAVLASIIGNTFDFGVQGHNVREDDFSSFFDEMFSHGLDVDDTPAIAGLAKNGDVVYLTDNCGEIYFDELVIDQLKAMNARITLVVRGGYILTDATMDDVDAMGLDRKVDRVMTTGSTAIGVDLKLASPELKKAMSEASVIISKGMANYESLSDAGYHNMAYLLRAKCEPVAKSLGVQKGMNVARLLR